MRKCFNVIMVVLAGTVCLSVPVFSAEENTTAYEFQGFEFQIPDEWLTMKGINGISSAIVDENTKALVSWETAPYAGDDFQVQFNYVDNLLEEYGAGSDSFQREDISKYTAGDWVYLISRFSLDGSDYVFAFLPDKTSDSTITIMLKDNIEGDSVVNDYLTALSSIAPVEDKISQTVVWSGNTNEEAAAEPDVNAQLTNPESSTDSLSMAQKNAVTEAQSYLNYSSFSRAGLIEQLSSEYGSGYSVDDATFAVNYLESNGMVDWNEQAVKEARSYLEYSSFSRDGLFDQLTSEYGSQFTPEQAEYALQQVYDM